MFKFLKEKLKSAVSQFSEGVKEKGKEEVKEIPKEETKSAAELLQEIDTEEKEGFFAKLKGKFKKEEARPEEKAEAKEEKPEIQEKKKKEEPQSREAKTEKKKEEKPEEKAANEEEKQETIRKEEKKEEKKEEHKEEHKEEESKKKKFKEEKKELIAKIEEVKEEIEEIKKEEKSAEKLPGSKIEIEKKKAEVFEKVKEIREEAKEEAAEEKGFFAKLKEKIVTKKINESQFEELFWELEVALLENNVAVEVIEKIKEELKKSLVNIPIQRGAIENKISETLKKTIEGLFDVEKIDILRKAKEKKPLVICFFGINGSGKTTTIAKIAHFFKKNNLSCVLAAADTFRAAAIDQLQTHAERLGVKIIKQDYGSDAAAVAFDAIKHAQAKNIDIVLIDTAGRMHSNVNLMEEMEKIIRVAKPDLKIFVGESITGNDCTEQAKSFNDSVGIDGIVLSKADIDEKGGAAISVSYVTGKPILFIGTGQEYDDLEEFKPEAIVNSLF